MIAAGIPHSPRPRSCALDYVRSVVMPAAFSMLPAPWDTRSARVEVLAIGLQESRFEHRRQVSGPALSFWQAESGGGFRGLLQLSATRDIARDVLWRMGYGDPDPSDFFAIEHNDILACIGARLLLWSHPKPLPTDAQGGWAYYVETWRPGKPHPETWPAFYAQAQDLVPQ